MSNVIAPGSSTDVNVKVTALTTNPNVPVTYKTIILKKNLVNGVNTLTQEMMSATNIKYVIKYDYVLSKDIIIPENCILEFDGGSVFGKHTITGQNTNIEASLVKVFNTDVTISGTWNVTNIYPEWFGAKGDGVTDDSDAINTALSVNCNGRTFIKFNCGVYFITKTLVTQRKTVLEGVGTAVDYYIDIQNDNNKRASVILCSDNFTENAYAINASIANFTMSNISLVGYSTSSVWSKANGVKTGAGTNINFCNITNFRTGIHVGGMSKIQNTNVQFCSRIGFSITNGDSRLINCEASYCGTKRYPGSEQTPDGFDPETNYYGIGIFMQGGNSQIINCLIDWNCTGIWCNGAHGIIINSNRFNNNAGRHIFLKASSNGAHNSVIVGNKFLGGAYKLCQESDNMSGIVYIDGNSNNPISNVLIVGNNFKIGDWTASDSISVENPGVTCGPVNNAISIASWKNGDTFNLTGNDFNKSSLSGKWVKITGYDIGDVIFDNSVLKENIDYSGARSINLINGDYAKDIESVNYNYLSDEISIIRNNRFKKAKLESFHTLQYIDIYAYDIGLTKIISNPTSYVSMMAIVYGMCNRVPFHIIIGTYNDNGTLIVNVLKQGASKFGFGIYKKGTDVFIKSKGNASDLYKLYIASPIKIQKNIGKLTDDYTEITSNILAGTVDTYGANSDEGAYMYRTDLKKPLWSKGGNNWCDVNGYTPALSKGTTTDRPTSRLTASDVGFQYFDTTLGYPIYWNGLAWVNATGITV